MSENKFENQVQHLMDELKFTPSEQVWSAIKNRIRQKRRRRFFFFLVPVMAGLLFTGYYFLTKTSNSPVSQNATNAPAQKFETSVPGNDNSPADNLHIKNSNKIQPNEPGLILSDNVTEQPKTKVNDELAVIDPVTNQIPIAKPKPAEELNTLIGLTDPVTKSKPDDQPEEKIFTESAIDQKLEASNVIQNNVAEILQDSVSHILDTEQNEKITDSVKQVKDTAKVVQIEKDPRSKWSWGIHVAAGISRSGSKTLPGFTSALMDFNATPNAGGPLFAYASKSSQTGTSIEAGLILKRQFTPRSSITSGLQYFYASDRIMAGSRYDSTIRVQNPNAGSVNFDNTVNSYYRGNDQWYNNHYHFIELPLHYQFLLNKKSKIPIQLQAGLIFSQLISTNGLVYDRSLAGIYYEDKKQFNQSMLSLSSGISFQLNHKQKLKWSIGPQLRAGITSMRKATYDQNKYLFSAGLGVNLFID